MIYARNVCILTKFLAHRNRIQYNKDVCNDKNLVEGDNRKRVSILTVASEIWRSDMDCFKEATKQFYNKELLAKDYKGISGAYGSYAQRGGEASMLRLRLSGGRITKEKLRFLVHSIERHKVNKIHFTTCQTMFAFQERE